MRSSFRPGAAVLVCALVLCSVAASLAQDASGDARLGGQVVEEGAGPLASIKLRFIPLHDEKARVPEATTNKSGRFSVGFCPPGSYRIELSVKDLFVTKLAVIDRMNGRPVETSSTGPETGPAFPVRPGQALELTITAQRGAPAAAGGGSNAALAQANELLQKGDNEGVIAVTDKVLATEPQSGGAHYLRGIALFRLKRSGDAVIELRRAVELVPKQPGVKGVLGAALLDHALELDNAGRKDDAKPLFAEAAGLLEGDAANMPDPGVSLTNAVIAYQHAGMTDQALAAAAKLTAARPDDVPLRLRYVDGLIKAGRKDEAAKELASIRFAPGDAQNRLRVAELQTNLGLLEAALATLEPVPIDSKDAAAVFYNVGVGYVNGGTGAKAIAIFERVIKGQPDLAYVHHALAMAYLGANRLADAKRELNESLRLEPKGENAEIDRQLLSKL